MIFFRKLIGTLKKYVMKNSTELRMKMPCCFEFVFTESVYKVSNTERSLVVC